MASLDNSAHAPAFFPSLGTRMTFQRPEHTAEEVVGSLAALGPTNGGSCAPRRGAGFVSTGRPVAILSRRVRPG